MGLEQLSERYAEHNRVERGAGFVFAGPERIELFRRYVGGPGRSVLDLGCRDGSLTRAYAGGNEIVGVDADREALAAAAQLGIETRWADLDEPLAFGEATFDVVVAGELLEHLRDPARLVADVRRVLRPGGRARERCGRAFGSSASSEARAAVGRSRALPAPAPRAGDARRRAPGRPGGTQSPCNPRSPARRACRQRLRPCTSLPRRTGRVRVPPRVAGDPVLARGRRDPRRSGARDRERSSGCGGRRGR